MGILLSADWTDWEQAGFDRAIADARVEITVLRQQRTPRSRARRYLAAFGESRRVMRAMRRHDAALIWQQVIGVAVGVLATDRLLRRCPATIMGFIDSDAGPGPLRALRASATARAVRRAERVICYSSEEAVSLRKRFPESSDRIHFVPLGFDPPVARASCGNPAVLSPGVSNRDFGTLFTAARSVDAQFIVYAPRDALMGAGDIPDNVHVPERFDWLDFSARMAAAQAVVVALDDPSKTSGQLVAIHAMHLGRPIVATCGSALADYLDDRVAVLVEPHDPRALADALTRLLADDVFARRLGDGARERAVRRLTANAFWGQVLALACDSD